MSIPIFLSHPKPHIKNQEKFINDFKSYLIKKGYSPETLVSDYNNKDCTLSSIQNLMSSTYGLITVALRRTHIEKGSLKYLSDLENNLPKALTDSWSTSSYCQIEAAMAFLLNIPVLNLIEKKVIREGILEDGILGLYAPEIDLLNNFEEYIKKPEWEKTFNEWEKKITQLTK